MTVKLPTSLNLISPEGSCEVVVNCRGRDEGSWWEVYDRVRAVEAVCVRGGMGGMVWGLGREGGVWVVVRGGS